MSSAAANRPRSILSALAAKARRLSLPGRPRHVATVAPIPLKPMPNANRHYHEAIDLNPAVITTPRVGLASISVSGTTSSAASMSTSVSSTSTSSAMHPTGDPTNSSASPPDAQQGDPICTPRYTKVKSPAMDTLDPPAGIENEPLVLPDLHSQIPADKMRAPIPHADKGKGRPASVLVEASNSPLADPTPPKNVYEKVERAFKSAMNPLSAQGEAAATSMALKKQGFDKMRGEDT